MKLNSTPYFFFVLVLSIVVSCGYSNQGANKIYYSVIKKEKSIEQKDSLYANSDLAAVDSTIRRFYQIMNDYQVEKSKNVNNPYALKPLEWHTVNKEGKYVTSVSESDIAAINKKYSGSN